MGYDPPAEAFQELLAKMKAGGPESYKGLSAAYAKNPKDVATVFALAQKKSERYPADQVAALYKQVVALDPNGKAGTTEYRKEKIPYTESAEFEIGKAGLQVMPPSAPDPAPLLAFVKKYPESAIVKEAFGFMANFYFARTAPKPAIPRTPWSCGPTCGASPPTRTTWTRALSSVGRPSSWPRPE